MIAQPILEKLNAKTSAERLQALKELVRTAAFPAPDPRYINNHIHTTYSFSPYSPTAAAYSARYYGLSTAGIMDHDSIGGAREFLAAGEMLGLPTTIGLECRVRMDNTPFAHIRTNNPDQPGVSYMTLQAVPHKNIERVQAYFAPLRERRNARNRRMTAKADALVRPHGLALDFDLDVLPLSEYRDGGSVTERHILFSLSKKIMAAAKDAGACIALLTALGVEPAAKQRALLADMASPYYAYDLLGILKSAFVPRIYIDAADECPELSEIVAFAAEVNAILCYAYLGDVKESVTGDKKAQAFEDAYLDELFDTLKKNGVHAVTYMPPRNTGEQLARIRALCKQYEMMQISGEDINSPRQDFVCKAMEDPQFQNLIDAAWALIAHERDANGTS